ncbi:MAG: hypothetical protein AB7K64_04645 [Variibacter sp.]
MRVVLSVARRADSKKVLLVHIRFLPPLAALKSGVAHTMRVSSKHRASIPRDESYAGEIWAFLLSSISHM